MLRNIEGSILFLEKKTQYSKDVMSSHPMLIYNFNAIQSQLKYQREIWGEFGKMGGEGRTY